MSQTHMGEIGRSSFPQAAVERAAQDVPVWPDRSRRFTNPIAGCKGERGEGEKHVFYTGLLTKYAIVFPINYKISTVFGDLSTENDHFLSWG